MTKRLIDSCIDSLVRVTVMTKKVTLQERVINESESFVQDVTIETITFYLLLWKMNQHAEYSEESECGSSPCSAV